jgi:hypothetical protein
VVTSVLQTTAGKMIFGRFIESGTVPAAPTANVVSTDTDTSRRPRPQAPPSAAAAGK